MVRPTWLLAAVAVAALAYKLALAQGMSGESVYAWQEADRFDEITARMDNVNAVNCKSKPQSELYLPDETLAQLPRFNKLLSTIIYPNRTNLLHLHNMALNRAFFFSYIFQKLNETHHFDSQPGLMYYYFSAAADVSANEYNINGSAVFFDNNCTYANWYRDLPFNKTLGLFGPRAWRFDDYNEPTNWLREPTNATINLNDYGAGPQSNYSLKSYKTNQWYRLWLPDGWDKEGQDSVRKHSYDVGIKYSNETGRFTDDEFTAKLFYGPPSPGQKDLDHLPVVFTEPYFDCGRANKWIVSAVAPVVDWVPRYLEWFHLRRHKFVGVVSMDIDFLSVDMNQCPLGTGNEAPNYFADTARCKKGSTMCEPLYGWGFRRGGYQCVCRPGFRYPLWQEGPFQGRDIETATEDEYQRGFDCIPVGLRQVIPVIRTNDTNPASYDTRTKREIEDHLKLVESLEGNWQPDWVRKHNRAKRAMPKSVLSAMLSRKKRFLRILNLKEEEEFDLHNRKKRRIVARQDYVRRMDSTGKTRKFVPRYKRDVAKIRRKRQAFDQLAFERMSLIITHKERVNKDNCNTFKREDLELPGDVSYGVEKQFSPQARTALRLSHFLSNFLQNVDRYEEYGNLQGDNLLNVEQMFGEVVANVMGDLKIKGSGLYFDVDKFEAPDGKTRQFFGPFAYRYEADNTAGGPTGDKANTEFRAVDAAGFPKHYLDEPWFKNVKERWQSNTYGLTKYTEKPMIRSDLDGTSLKRFEMYPMYYFAPNEEDGWWSAPYFDCDGHVNDWVITYSIPFFGLNSIRSGLEFKGVVTVDVKLDELDIQQCPSDFHVPNAFKNTARCHYESTYCEYLPSKKFTKGAYKCECKQGFEYPFNDRAWYYDGQTMEEEYRKKVEGIQTRYDTLKCRIAGASQAGLSLVLLAVTLLAATITRLSS